ncbi:hypothetical protein EXS45_02140 [Candidatus Nomurabacteria bacterium]|nr:hypothetical protein [Candidatus Nomurabacteria bacterium]
MTENLNLKKLAVGMSLEDKAKLCFADRLKRAESNDREWLLTGQEREAIYSDAGKNNQMKGLNKLIEKYNVVVFLWADAGEDFRTFSLMKGVQSYTDFIFESLPDEALDAIKESVLRFEKTALLEIPNQNGISPMELYLIIIRYAKSLNMTIYKIEYIETSTDFNFLSDEMRSDLNKYKEELKTLDKSLEKYYQLNQEDKKEAEKEADWMIERFSRINFNTSG